MNVLECEITKILKEPYYYPARNVWVVEYEYDCHGQISTGKDWLKTKEDAEKFKIGYVFMA